MWDIEANTQEESFGNLVFYSCCCLTGISVWLPRRMSQDWVEFWADCLGGLRENIGNRSRTLSKAIAPQPAAFPVTFEVIRCPLSLCQSPRQSQHPLPWRKMCPGASNSVEHILTLFQIVAITFIPRHWKKILKKGKLITNLFNKLRWSNPKY